MPAQYEIHTSATKSILLIEYSVEQLAGHCVIIADIVEGRKTFEAPKVVDKF